MCAIGRIHNGFKGIFSFMHTASSHECTLTHRRWTHAMKDLAGLLIACWYILSGVCLEMYWLSYLQYGGWFLFLIGPFRFWWLKGYICAPSHHHGQIGSLKLSHSCLSMAVCLRLWLLRLSRNSCIFYFHYIPSMSCLVHYGSYVAFGHVPTIPYH